MRDTVHTQYICSIVFLYLCCIATRHSSLICAGVLRIIQRGGTERELIGLCFLSFTLHAAQKMSIILRCQDHLVAGCLAWWASRKTSCPAKQRGRPFECNASTTASTYCSRCSPDTSVRSVLTEKERLPVTAVYSCVSTLDRLWSTGMPACTCAFPPHLNASHTHTSLSRRTRLPDHRPKLRTSTGLSIVRATHGWQLERHE